MYEVSEIRSKVLQADDFKLHYRQNGEAKLAVVVWLHGTPGGWDSIGRLLADPDFTSQVKMVAVDRPGWGGSMYQASSAAESLIGSFAEHSRQIGRLLQQLKTEHPDKPLVLGGHSWGGSIAPALAADHMSIVDGVGIFAGGLDPDLVKPRWYNRIASTWPVRRMIDDDLRKANLEVYSLAPQLAAYKERFRRLRMPIVVVQGESDKLVDRRNADYAEAIFNAETTHVVRLPDQGHFLHTQRTELIGRCLMALATGPLTGCN